MRFYRDVFDAEIVRESEIMAELTIAGGTLGIHSGGEGKRTWTGLAFQIGDLFAACDALRAAGGLVLRPPEDTPEERPISPCAPIRREMRSCSRASGSGSGQW